MPIGDVTVHSAQLVRMVETGAKIEGERVIARQLGAVFDVFLTYGQSETPRSPTTETLRGVAGGDTRRGSIMWEPPAPELTNEDRLLIVAEELTGPTALEWMLDGDPVPLAAPGDLIGFEARVVRVEA